MSLLTMKYLSNVFNPKDHVFGRVVPWREVVYVLGNDHVTRYNFNSTSKKRY